MKLKELFNDRFKIAAVMNGNDCLAESFITEGEAAYQASREGLVELLFRVAANGLLPLSSKLTHIVDETNKIYEFVKGDLRLFYFKGIDGVLIVCTAGVVKKGQKVDKRAVAAAIEWQRNYHSAVKRSEIEWDDTEE